MDGLLSFMDGLLLSMDEPLSSVDDFALSADNLFSSVDWSSRKRVAVYIEMASYIVIDEQTDHF